MMFSTGADRRDALMLGGLLTLGVGFPLVLGLLAGTLDIPRNDDWAYRRIALELAQTGHLALNVRTMIIGQILAVQPLLWLSGTQSWAFTAFGVVAAGWVVVSTYALARQFLVPARAAMPVLLLLLFPGYLAYATSFMSDMPAVASQMTCLTLGIVALRRRPIRDRWLLASVVVGVFGVSLRDFALAAPAVVLLAALLADMRRLRYWALAAAVACAYAGLIIIRSALIPVGQPSIPTTGSSFQIAQAAATVSLVLAPAALIGAARWCARWHRPDLAIGVELAVLAIAPQLLSLLPFGVPMPVFLPNLLSQRGSPQQHVFLGERPLLFAETAWAALSVVGVVACFVTMAAAAGIAGTVIRRHRGSLQQVMTAVGSPSGVLGLFPLAVVTGLSLFGLISPLFDRYFWPAVPPLAVILLGVASGPAPAVRGMWRQVRLAAPLAATSLVLTGSVAVALALNAAALDAALWRSGETLVRAGVRADEIDAGYTWFGYHATGPISDGVSSKAFYRAYWPAFHECGVVMSDPEVQPGTELVGTESYSLYLIAGSSEQLYLFRRTDVACRAQ
jgi:hypothetical protein